jgi:hypothetical protein
LTYITSLLLLLAGAGASSHALRNELVIGSPNQPIAITSTIANNFSAEARQKTTLRIDSVGGDADAAYTIATLIRQRQIDLNIGICLSACADIIVPASNSVHVNANTLLGYHVSDLLVRSLSIRPEFQGKNFCGAERNTWLDEMYRRHGLHSSFSRDVIAHLSIAKISAEWNVSRGCYIADIIPYTSMWFPTGIQLRNLLGLQIPATICADTETCWRERIPHIARPGQIFAIGDRRVILTPSGKLNDISIPAGATTITAIDR